MFNTKTSFSQVQSNGRFQFRFKPTIDLGSKQTLTPTGSAAILPPMFSTKSDQLDKQRHHGHANLSPHFEDYTNGIKTYQEANRRSDHLVSLETLMQRKKRLANLAEKRNNIAVRSPGDKIYPYPEYEHDFFRQNTGLVPGSNIKNRPRHPYKISKKFHG